MGCGEGQVLNEGVIIRVIRAPFVPRIGVRGRPRTFPRERGKPHPAPDIPRDLASLARAPFALRKGQGFSSVWTFRPLKHRLPPE